MRRGDHKPQSNPGRGRKAGCLYTQPIGPQLRGVGREVVNSLGLLFTPEMMPWTKKCRWLPLEVQKALKPSVMPGDTRWWLMGRRTILNSSECIEPCPRDLQLPPIAGQAGSQHDGP